MARASTTTYNWRWKTRAANGKQEDVKQSPDKDTDSSQPKKDKRVTRSKTKALFGEGKPRKANTWLQYCQDVKNKNPNLSYKEILSLASTTYKKNITLTK